MRSTHHHTDQELLRQLASGNEDAFSQLYLRHWEMTYASAYKRLQDPVKAKDIVQDIFLQLWTRRDSLQIENLQGYLHVSTKNRVLQVFNEEERFTDPEILLMHLADSPWLADAGIIRKELMLTYNALVDELSPAQQKIFRMRYEEQLSTEEIANKLAIKRRVVQNQLRLSLLKIRTSMLSLLILSTITKLPN